MQHKYDKHQRLRALSLSVSFVFAFGSLTDAAYAENVNTLSQLEKRIAKLPPASEIKPFVAIVGLAPWQTRMSAGKTLVLGKSQNTSSALSQSATASQSPAPLPKEFSESFRAAAKLPADYLKNNGDKDYASKLDHYIQYAADHPAEDAPSENKPVRKHRANTQLAKEQPITIYVQPTPKPENKRDLASLNNADVDPVDRNRQLPAKESRDEIALNTSSSSQKKFTLPFLQSVQSTADAPSPKLVAENVKSESMVSNSVAITAPVAPAPTLLSNLPWLTQNKPAQPAPVVLASNQGHIIQTVKLETVQSLGTATVQTSGANSQPKPLLELPDPGEAPTAPVNVSDLPPAPTQNAKPALPTLKLPAPIVSSGIVTPVPVQAPVIVAPSPVVVSAPVVVVPPSATIVPLPLPQPVIHTSTVPVTTAQSSGNFIPPLPSANNLISAKQDQGLPKQDRDILKHLPPEKISKKSSEPVEIERARENTVEAYADERSHKGVGIQISIKQPKANITRMLENAYNDLIAGDQENAISLYKQVLESEPSNKLALFGLATTYQRAGQTQLARPLYGKLLAIDPHNVEGLNNFLVLLADEDPKDALVELSKLEVSHPGLSIIPAQEAIIYEKTGDYESAAHKMSIAINLSPENLKFRYDMAVILDKKGDWSSASELYKQLLTASDRGEKIAANPEQIQERLTFIMSNRPKVQPTGYYYGNN